jgi:hypothetical protein
VLYPLFCIGPETVGNDGEVGWRKIFPKTFFNLFSMEEREEGSDEPVLGLLSLRSDGDFADKRKRKAFDVWGGEDGVGVTGDQTDRS